MGSIFELAKVLNIKINKPEIYELALTHPSCNQDNNTKHHDYQRLEFMGDAVLGFVSADLIYNHYPDMEPGDMSKLRAALVNSNSLAKYGRQIGLPSYIKIGKCVTKETIESSKSIIEDIFEAVLGAIYLDLGIQTAFRVVKNFIYDDLINFDLDSLTDHKTKLQEAFQAEHRDYVRYESDFKGPPHNRTFIATVYYGKIPLGTGVGKSKKAAEEAAARDALSKRRDF